MEELSEEDKNEIFYLLSKLDEEDKRVKYLRKLAFSLIRKHIDKKLSGNRFKFYHIGDYKTSRLVKILKTLFETGELRE